MKIRNGFVSNSSSSSFIVYKQALTDLQKRAILNFEPYVEFFKEMLLSGIDFNDVPKLQEMYPDEKYEFEQIVKMLDNVDINMFEYYNDSWNISENTNLICGDTIMDNFDMDGYLRFLGVDFNYVRFTGPYEDDSITYSEFVKQCLVKMRKKKLDKLEE